MAKTVKETKVAEVRNPFSRISSVVRDLNSHYGKNLVKTGNDIPSIHKVPFDEPTLDYVSDGGIPIGRITEFLGDTHCLHSDTFIHYQTRTEEGRIQTDKGGSIKTLYTKFHKKDKLHKRRLKTIDSEYYIQSISSDDTVFMNKIVDVFFNGIRDCYEVKTNAGKTLISTLEHEYYVGNSQFKKLKDLTAGDTIYSYDRKAVRKDFTNKKTYKEVFIKGYHPKLGVKKVDIYEYYRGLEHRLIYEAFLNNLSYDNYIKLLNEGNIEIINSLNYIPKGYQIHHKDDDTTNNNLDNLQMVTLKEHNEIHSKIDALKKAVYKDEITSITYIGTSEVYDIECADPYHNYIAQGIVVHNSGKTRNALKSMGKFQRYCFNCHTPNALDVVWELDKDNNPFVKSCTCKNCTTPKPTIQVMVDIEGCIAEDQEIFDPVTGFVGSIGDYAKEPEKNVINYGKGKLKISKPLAFFDSGELETMRINTKTTSLKATPNHPVLCFREGKEVWVRMDELIIGDYIARNRKINITPVKSNITREDAELLGMLLGDGGMSNKDRASLTFTNIDDDVWYRLGQLLLKWNYTCERHSDRHSRLKLKTKKGIKYDKGTLSPLKSWLNSFGLLGTKSDTKFIPKELLLDDIETISALLRGLWITDGGVHNSRPSLTYTTTSRKIAVQIRWLLARLGIVGRITKVDDGDFNHKIWYNITINSYRNIREFQKYVKLYGYKGNIADRWSKRPIIGRESDDNYLPNYNPRTQKGFNNTDIWWDKITEITLNTGKVRCFDATVDKTHSWTVNDIVVHNTTDPVFMENFGIQTNGVIYVRPDLPSQAVGIVDTFLRMPEVGLILLDSIGSMGSDKEVETAIEDDKMNQNALFFNKAIRKWQMALNSNTNETGLENGTSMIIINQSYMTLSIFSTEVAQGGRGLRHGKAMSLKTRIKEKNKEPKTDKILGCHIEYKNEKNKTGIPYRKKDYYLNLDPTNDDVGYCQTNTILQYIELAIEFGIITQKGGWFEFNNKKWQGKASLLDAFDDDIKNAVDNLIYKKN